LSIAQIELTSRRGYTSIGKTCAKRVVRMAFDLQQKSDEVLHPMSLQNLGQRKAKDSQTYLMVSAGKLASVKIHIFMMHVSHVHN